MTMTLAVTKRDTKQKSDDSTVLGVVYGPKHEPVSLAVNRKACEKVISEAGESTIVTLTGLGDDVEVLIHDVAFNAVRGGIQHIDFYAIERGKELTTNVPLEFVGQAPVEKTGSTVNKILHDIEVTCTPSNLPSHIDVDLSVLTDEESQIRVSDLVLPNGVTVENDPEEIVANVAGLRADEPEESGSLDMSAIEVVGKGKTDAADDAVAEK